MRALAQPISAEIPTAPSVDARFNVLVGRVEVLRELSAMLHQTDAARVPISSPCPVDTLAEAARAYQTTLQELLGWASSLVSEASAELLLLAEPRAGWDSSTLPQATRSHLASSASQGCEDRGSAGPSTTPRSHER